MDPACHKLFEERYDAHRQIIAAFCACCAHLLGEKQGSRVLWVTHRHSGTYYALAHCIAALVHTSNPCKTISVAVEWASVRCARELINEVRTSLRALTESSVQWKYEWDNRHEFIVTRPDGMLFVFYIIPPSKLHIAQQPYDLRIVGALDRCSKSRQREISQALNPVPTFAATTDTRYIHRASWKRNYTVERHAD